MTPARELDSTASAVRRLLDDGSLELADPGSGHTALRLRRLIELARLHPVSVARLIEAHVDAVAILHEAGRHPSAGALYGVWASATPGTDGPLIDGGVLHGTKLFCSGLGIVDRALMTVATPGPGAAHVLVDVDARPGPTIVVDTTQWATPALQDTATGRIDYRHHDLDVIDPVGGPGWYLARPGFWHGACGPAACWAGATFGLVDAARRSTSQDPHQVAQLGAMSAVQWALAALHDAAGSEIDERPDDRDAAEYRARSLRHVTERLCQDVLDRFGRAMGPRPFATDAAVAQRFADTHLYLRQHHGERELGAVRRGDRADESDE